MDYVIIVMKNMLVSIYVKKKKFLEIDTTSPVLSKEITLEETPCYKVVDHTPPTQEEVEPRVK